MLVLLKETFDYLPMVATWFMWFAVHILMLKVVRKSGALLITWVNSLLLNFLSSSISPSSSTWQKNTNDKIVASFCYKWSFYRTFPTIFWISSAESWPWKSVAGLWRTIQRQTPVSTVWQPAQCHWSRWSCPGREEMLILPLDLDTTSSAPRVPILQCQPPGRSRRS